MHVRLGFQGKLKDLVIGQGRLCICFKSSDINQFRTSRLKIVFQGDSGGPLWRWMGREESSMRAFIVGVVSRERFKAVGKNMLTLEICHISSEMI